MLGTGAASYDDGYVPVAGGERNSVDVCAAGAPVTGSYSVRGDDK